MYKNRNKENEKEREKIVKTLSLGIRKQIFV